MSKVTQSYVEVGLKDGINWYRRVCMGTPSVDM